MIDNTLTPMEKCLHFIDRIEATTLFYNLDHVRDAIMVTVFVPGQRWEIEFFADGNVEVERYISTGKIEYEDILEELFTTFAV
jgi:hypothetical protein